MNYNIKQNVEQHDHWVVLLIIDALMKGQEFSTSKFTSTLGVRQLEDMSGTFVQDGTPDKYKAWTRVLYGDANWVEAMRVIRENGYHLFACWGVQNPAKCYIVRKSAAVPYGSCCERVF